MTILSISEAPELLKIDGTEKIPTGGKGDFSVTLKKVSDFTVENAGKVFDPKLDLKADKSEIPSNEMIMAMEKEDRFVKTWSGRTQEQKNKDSISVRDYIKTKIDGTTSNQDGITQAVFEAYHYRRFP